MVPRRNEQFFDQRRVDELIKFGLTSISIEKLRYRVIPRLGLVYDSYAADVARVIDLAKFSTYLTLQSCTFAGELTKVIYEETGCFAPPRSVRKKYNDNIRLSMMKLEDERPPRSDAKLFKDVCNLTRMVIERADVKLLDGYDAIMPSLIVLAWTAFEALSEDLLSKAVKFFPRSLSQSNWCKTRRKLAPWEQMTISGSIRTHSDVPKNPGLHHLSYRTIEAIRKSYWLVFRSDCAKIRRALSHRSLDNLHAARNVIVHKSGKVDQIFLNRTAGVPMFAKAIAGNYFHMDFAMVNTLVLPVLNRGIQLIAVVNDWVRAHG